MGRRTFAPWLLAVLGACAGLPVPGPAAPLRVAPSEAGTAVATRSPKAAAGKVLGARAIRYRVRLGGPRRLEVRADFPALAADEPTVGFYSGYARWIEGLTAHARGGSRIPVRFDRDAEAWTVAARGRPFTLRYRVVSRKPSFTGKSGEDRVFEPAIFPDWVLLWGDSYLVRPRDEPAFGGGYRIFVDRGPYEAYSATFRAGELLRSDYELDESLLIAGDFRHYRTAAAGIPLHFAIRGKRWAFTDDAWIERIRAMVDVQVAFMGRAPVPRILVVLVEGDSSVYSGFCTRDSFVVFPVPPARLDDPEGDILGVVAHELFHFWCGGLTTNWKLANGHTNWFVEGFCEYYAALTLLRLGWETPLEFVARMNRTLRAYLENPGALAADRRLLETFIDQDSSLGELPYWKGALLAWMLDLDIRKKTGGRRTLDDYVRLVVANAPEHDNLRLRLQLTRLAGSSWRGFFDRYVEGSEPLPLEEFAARHGLTIEVPRDEPEIEVAELGFSVTAAAPAGPGRFEVARVHPGSAALAAGLRPGDLLEDLDLVLDPGRECAVTVRRGARRIELGFRPVRTVRVPRLSKDGAAVAMARRLARYRRGSGPGSRAP